MLSVNGGWDYFVTWADFVSGLNIGDSSSLLCVMFLANEVFTLNDMIIEPYRLTLAALL